MREIKFRAWSKENKVMFVNEILKNAADGMIKISKEALIKQGLNEAASNLQCGIFLPTEDKDLVFMQYTGIEDKNGKEIYEGDIFISDNNNKYEVVFVDGGFKLSNIKYPNQNLQLLDRMNSNYGEVIGNIYENEDLLEK